MLKNQIVNTIKPTDSNPKNKIISDDNKKNISIIDFKTFICSPIRCLNFTNFAKTDDNLKKIYNSFFHQMLPHITGNNIIDIKSGPHTHPIEGEAQIKLIKRILKENLDSDKYESVILNYTTGAEFWQICGLNGMRLISMITGVSIAILFLDPYHLIYPNKNFSNDFNNYRYPNFPVINENLAIIKIEEELLEHCIDCDILDKITHQCK